MITKLELCWADHNNKAGKNIFISDQGTFTPVGAQGGS